MDKEQEAREKLEDLKLSLKGLAKKLKVGAVRASQVVEAVDASLRPVKKGGIEVEERTGVEMTENDPAFAVVLTDLSDALVDAFFQEKNVSVLSPDDVKDLSRVVREIGSGTAVGKFDADFFKNIKVLS